MRLLVVSENPRQQTIQYFFGAKINVSRLYRANEAIIRERPLGVVLLQDTACEHEEPDSVHER